MAMMSIPGISAPLTAAERAQRSVFVGNIPYEATEEQLKEIFTQAGPVVSFRLVYDRETGKPKGYGFCEYQDVETAQSAMRNLNNYDFSGRPLRVGVAAGEQSKEEMKSMQQALGGPIIESPFGDPVEPEKAPEAISKAVASLPPEQMFELMKQMKLCIQNNPNEARNMLLQNPQLAYALLQAQIVMKIVDPQVALAMLHRQTDQIPPLLPSSSGAVPPNAQDKRGIDSKPGMPSPGQPEFHNSPLQSGSGMNERMGGAPIMNDRMGGPMGGDRMGGTIGGDRMGAPMGGDRMGGDRMGGPVGGDRMGGPMGGDRMGGPMGGDRIGGPMGGERMGGPMGGDRIGGPMGGDRMGGPMGGDRMGGPMGGDRMGGPMGGDRMGGPMGGDRMGAPMGGDRMGGPMGGDRMGGPGSGGQMIGNERMGGRMGGADRMGGPMGNDRMGGSSGPDRMMGPMGGNRMGSERMDTGGPMDVGGHMSDRDMGGRAPQVGRGGLLDMPSRGGSMRQNAPDMRDPRQIGSGGMDPRGPPRGGSMQQGPGGPGRSQASGVLGALAGLDRGGPGGALAGLDRGGPGGALAGLDRGGPGGPRGPGGPDLSDQDHEKAALIMQVLKLSEQQIAMLPPDQRQSILILKEQISRSHGPPK